MASKKNATLLKTILQQTKTGVIKWEATYSDETFQASFPKYSVRIIRIQYPPQYEEDDGIIYEFDIYNKEGKLIEELYPSDVVLQNPHSVFREIFFLARRMVFRVDNAVDELLNDLGVGHPEISEDELAF